MSGDEGLREAVIRRLDDLNVGGWIVVPDRNTGEPMQEQVPLDCIADAVLALPQVSELRGKVERVEALAKRAREATKDSENPGAAMVWLVSVEEALEPAAALAPRPSAHTPQEGETCPHGDPSCPCPDGLQCHYEGDDAWPSSQDATDAEVRGE